MSATEPFCTLFDINPYSLTYDENILLESDLFLCIYEELKETFRIQHKDYFHLMKFTIEKENNMLESNFACLIMQDILLTGEYTLEGIAHYTNSHEEVIQEIYLGQNLYPSAYLLRKILELHRLVRRELYSEVSKKIIQKHLSVA